ncbi:MAG: hypothetical protein ACRDUX_27080 [Mycobacterium sp.]
MNSHDGPAQTFLERGFPHMAHPTGWFQVGWSAGYALGQVMAERFFGQDLVFYRTDPDDRDALGHIVAWTPTALTWAPHLEYGGSVEGTCLRCPYHK